MIISQINFDFKKKLVCKIQTRPEENFRSVTFFTNITVALCYLPLAGGSGVLVLVEIPLDSSGSACRH